MALKKLYGSIKTSWSIYDSWCELLAGTRFLLDILETQDGNKIKRINLLRLVVVSSFQMVEVMLFTQLKRYIDDQPESTRRLFSYDLKRRINFQKAIRKWPEVLTGRKLDFGAEPMQSMKELASIRNSAIHHTAEYPKVNIGESALYTAIEASKEIYNHFNKNGWKNSNYINFVNDNQPKTKIFLLKVLGNHK